MSKSFACSRIPVLKSVAARIYDDDDDLTIATAVVCHASSSVLRLFDFTPL